jgi:YVTN family beta-propeller protein
MKKNSLFRRLAAGALLATSFLTFTNCTDKLDAPNGEYSKDGVFVVNEGNFGTPTGSITYYNKVSQEVQNGIFSKQNNKRPLGDVAQSMTIHNSRGYLVVNNSNKIEIVDAYTFKAEGVVTGLSAPRYFAALNNDKGYVTEWLLPNQDYSYNKGRVSVINLKTLTVIKTIEVGVQPEQLLITGGKVYVANQGGNTVTVINPATDVVEKNITVVLGPNSLVLGNNNILWVLSSGNKDWNIPVSAHTTGALTQINSTNNSVVNTFNFPKASAMASQLQINRTKDVLYYNYDGKVYQQSASSNSLNHLMLVNRTFYGLGIDPKTGNIYGADAGDFASDGSVFVYKPDGSLVNSFKVGIAPNGFSFN